ncbi:hypothetical protein V3W47_02435 [Deinococcus sp. YIM 134068]|uniref:hypothetical protein n=1 Tax=Deinococcus lichenicola TaxID=3118910 RepID=UPI002F9239D6
MHLLFRSLPPLMLAAVGVANAATLTLSPGQTGRLGDFTLTVLRVQDSRCRPDVQCVQAGELRASVLAREGNHVALLHFSLPAPLVTTAIDGRWLELRLEASTYDRPPRLTFGEWPR